MDLDGKGGGLACPDCAGRFPYVEGPICSHCGCPVCGEGRLCQDCAARQAELFRGGRELSFEEGRAVFRYTGEMKQTMYRFKYAGRREYAAFFADEALRRRGRWIRGSGAIGWLPVPMFAHKQRVRGYNQAEDLACELWKRTGIRMEAGLVARVRATVPMKGLDPVQRKENLRDAFAVDTERLRQLLAREWSPCLIVVDDIYTTGATVTAVSRVLQREARCLGRKVRIRVLSVCIGSDE